jgi:hypothetical protein
MRAFGIALATTLAIALVSPRALALEPPTPCEQRWAPLAKKLSIFLGVGYLAGPGSGFVRGEGLYYDLGLQRLKATTRNGECEWNADDARWFLRFGASWLSGIDTDTDRGEGNVSVKYIITKTLSGALGVSGGGLWQGGDDRGFFVGPIGRLDYVDLLSLEVSGARIFSARGVFDDGKYSLLAFVTIRGALWAEHVTRRTTPGAENP